MRKIFVTVVMLFLATVSAFADGFRPDFVPEEHIINKRVDLGKDSSGMTWLLLDYGTNNAGYYAVARKYYSNRDLKRSTVEQLISRYSIPVHKARELLFTDYRYEYTSDGLRYAEVYRRFYDASGRMIMGMECDGSSTARRKTFINVVRNTIQSKGLAYATGRLRK